VRDLAAFGPFFAVETHPMDSLPQEPWHAMSELVENPGILLDRILAVRAALAAAGGQAPGAVEMRVAASVAHLGLVARLISPALALAVTSGTVLEVALGSTWWQPVLGGAFPLSVSQSPPVSQGVGTVPAGRKTNLERLAALLASRVLDGPVRDLLKATMPWSGSRHVLWGNIASAVNGAASMMATCQPAWAQGSRTIAALLLDQPPLRGTSIVLADGGFRRRSCCLIYRAAPDAAGALCGDCVLSRDPPS
jgi:FhuF-like iron-sulfur protein